MKHTKRIIRIVMPVIAIACIIKILRSKNAPNNEYVENEKNNYHLNRQYGCYLYDFSLKFLFLCLSFVICKQCMRN